MASAMTNRGRGEQREQGGPEGAGAPEAEGRQPDENTGTGFSPVALKVLRAAVAGNLIALGVGIAIGLNSYGTSAGAAYAAGFILSAVNIAWLYRIAGRGLTMPPDKVARFVTVRYYLRFIITALLCVALIKKGYVSPLPFLVGITVAVVANIAVMIIVAKREAS
jgi:general stress protein CsbA